MYNIIRRLSKIARLSNTFQKRCFQISKKNLDLNRSSGKNNNGIIFNKYYSNIAQTDPEETSQPNIAAIANGDKELEHKLKVLILEVEVMRQEGKLVPESSFLKDSHWQELLKLPTLSARRRYLEFLFKICKKEENRMRKKQEKNLKWEETKPVKKDNETFEEFVSQYDLRHNNIFIRFYDSTMNQMYNNRLIQAMQFGQKLVVDCGYDSKMNVRENTNCAKQLMLLFAENRFHDDPYDLHFCNTNHDSKLIQTLHNHIPIMYEKWFPLNIHTCSYLDIFPKNQLVYLTPHCREELVEYNHDDVYIIGGIVDKVNQEPLSLAKAKKEGLRMAKLPLDRYLQWGSGSGKNLTLNQVLSILLDVKVTKNWQYALRHVPKRKIIDLNTNQNTENSSSFRNNHEMGKKRSWRPSQNSDFQDLHYNKRRTRIRDLLEE